MASATAARPSRNRDKAPLSVAEAGFSLHAATRAGAADHRARLALVKYILRPPIANERLELRPDDLVRIVLKKALTDGTFAIDMDPLSLLSRLAASAPPPRFHTIATRARSPQRPACARSSCRRPRPSPNRRLPRPKPASPAGLGPTGAGQHRRRRASHSHPPSQTPN
jgi:Putative transposase